uniref:Haloacid dehalogenase-like hydrolase n=1 Tax=Globisporangium ultimum (strain ATCC 200006 / CBS 805.95 / DAOM BR144) TaxID=431595 RepID=K3WLH7_GLOUD
MEEESCILERHRGRNKPSQQQQGGKTLETQQSQPSAASSLPYPLSTLPQKRNPALVIFNKDGTLIDFNSMWGGWIESQAWKIEAAAKLAIREQLYGAMGYDWNHRSVARFGALTTIPKKDLSRVAVDVLLVKGMVLSEAQRVVRECWSLPDPVMTCRPLADIPDIFRTIKQMGIKIAIRTTDNRESTKKSLAHMRLTNLVDDMVCGDDGLPIAPSPEQVWTLCNRLGVGVYNTVMVGDTPSDMALGRNSACSLSVGVFGGASALDDLAKDADILISSLDKITRVLFQYGQQASQQ